MSKRFVRRDTGRFSKLGKNRKKIQKWRKPKGMDNKMRTKRVGYAASPGVGYKTQKKEAGKIRGKMPVVISNEKEIKKLTKNSIAILSRRLGAKKKVEIIRKIKEKNFDILNLKGEIKK